MLTEIRRSLEAIVRDADITCGDLEDFAAIERLAAAGKLLALRHAAPEPAALAELTGISYGQARAAIDAASTLTPEVEHALRSGGLSESQAREVAPAVAADPTAASTLLAAARTEAFGKLEERCAKVRHAATDEAERDRLVYERRSLRIWQDHTGAGRIDVTGPLPVIARFEALLEPHRESAFRRGERAPAQAHAFDGFARWLDGRASTRSRRKRNPDAEVIVLVDEAALRRGHADPGETGEIAGLGPVSVAAASEVFGDALLSIVITSAVDVHSVVPTTRTINEVLQTAMLATGWRCSTASCPNVRRLQRDHVRALCNGGWTALRRLDLKCVRCHREKTRRDRAELRGRPPCG